MKNDYNFNAETVMVAGASGKLGRSVVELLVQSKQVRLIAASRHPERLQSLLGEIVEVRRIDYNDPVSLKEGFKGVDRLLLISTDELQTPGLRIKQHLGAIEAARVAAVSHIVYTSMPNPAASTAIRFAPDHVATEKALMKSGMGYTILRVSWYAENLLGYLPYIIRSGIWPTVAGAGRIAFIPRDDVARATAASLLHASGKAIYDIAGTDPLSVEDIADYAEEIFGVPINVVHMTDKQVSDVLLTIGLPPAFIPTVIMTDKNARAGQFNVSNQIVEELTGQRPQTVEEFLKKNKEIFADVA